MAGVSDQVEVDFVEREIRDLLDAGPVGLYEFIDAQRGREPELSFDSMRANAAVALERLLATGDYRLVCEEWANAGARREATSVTLADDVWEMPPSGPYLAIVHVLD